MQSEHARAAWARRATTTARRHSLRADGSCCAPRPTTPSSGTSGALISKMDTTQHNRGWDLSIEKGVVERRACERSAERGSRPKKAQQRKRLQVQRALRLSDTAGSDSEGSGAQQAAAEAKKEAAEERRTRQRRRKPEKPKPPRRPKDKRRWLRSRFQPSILCLWMAHGSIVFFTYDGSGKASGVKIYVNGKPVGHAGRLGYAGRQDDSHARLRCSSAGATRRANPAKETRYQDIRLYGARAHSRRSQAPALRRLCCRAWPRSPTKQWNDDQWHVVSQFYLNSVDKSYRALEDQIRAVECAARQALRGRRPDAGFLGEAFDRLCERADARRLHRAHRTSGGEYAALSARPCLRACRTTGWRWPNGR